MATPENPVDACMQRFQPVLPLAIALSGGADSTALLLACHRRWPGDVMAIHVHHGLQTAADDFQHFCETLCGAQGIALHTVYCDARHAVGESPENAARKARYMALVAAAATLQERLGRKLASIALAQHADDQVETLLLALSRGAGLPGMAAMPAYWQRSGLYWYRPFLAVAAAPLKAWLTAQGQSWVEDPTNADTAFTRNRIRQQLLPALEQTFPQFRSTFARSSAHSAQAQQLLQELAEQDLAACGLPLSLAALQQLSTLRQGNALRHWLKQQQGAAPTAAQLQELLKQIAAARTRGHAIALKVGTGRVHRVDDTLVWLK